MFNSFKLFYVKNSLIFIMFNIFFCLNNSYSLSFSRFSYSFVVFYFEYDHFQNPFFNPFTKNVSIHIPFFLFTFLFNDSFLFRPILQNSIPSCQFRYFTIIFLCLTDSLIFFCITVFIGSIILPLFFYNLRFFFFRFPIFAFSISYVIII